MKFRNSTFLVFTLLFVMTSACSFNSEQVTEEDYKRAESFLSSNTNDLVHGTISGVNWLDDGNLIYRHSLSNGTEFMIADPEAGMKERAFDHEKIAEALSKLTDEDISPLSLPFNSFSYEDEKSAIRFNVRGTDYRCTLNTDTCELLTDEDPQRNRNESISPDGKKAVFIRDYNLYMRNLETNRVTQLTTDGQQDFGYATNNAGWTKRDSPVLLWSPDSKRISTFQQDARGVGEMYLASTKVGHPELQAWKYPLPGDSLIFRLHRVVINLEPTPSIVRLRKDADPQRSTITDHVAGRGGNFLDNEWSEDSNTLAFVSVSRDHQDVHLQTADPNTGQVRSVLQEETDTFFESGVDGISWRLLKNSNEVIWFSQRSDWGHLYLYDLQSGALKNQITSGDWTVLEVLRVDESDRTIYFTGSGREEGDPYFKYLYRVNFDGSGLNLLTPEKANHEITLSESGAYFVDTYSTPATPPVSTIRNMNGEEVLGLSEANISKLQEAGWVAPTPFTVKARDGETDLYGLLYKPSNFNSSASYPVLNYLYPGPQSGSVGSRSFRASRSDKQAMAELGFIVVEVDAMGTPGRSKSFHEFYYGNMGDNGIPDQIAMIEQLGERHSWMDISRVGIYGHSGGGFASTRALLAYPDFYDVAVSGAGNHDNRNYADPWGEKWQGLLEVTPSEEDTEGKATNYDNQANQLLAENLKGKLLITHGTLDSNVPPYNTLLVVNALIEANKDFDMIMFPNRGHGYYGEDYMMRKRWDYFVRHLKDVEPPKEFEFGE
ncbi:MAG: DPP IV N-terminal domain-containing protein [Gracilimonas sp.]|uniref:S9 family peptidase n=1 Tax=Gracilimonas sp. TaxID=1974203 RepID=UPI0019CD8CBA|nr:S9 family peptidase [Gracilimonas sp.]MBD3615603.1 DPP IV N-terminal domain-containing protein [Gracilimonas sp.]